MRAISLRSLALLEELGAALRNPVAFIRLGSETTKASSTATIMQATPVMKPQDSGERRAETSMLSPILKMK